MNNHQLQLRLQQQRLRQKPFKAIQLEDDNMFFMVQDGQIQQTIQETTIQIDSEEEYARPKQELQQPRRTIAITDSIRPKLDVEYDEEPTRGQRMQVKEPAPQVPKIIAKPAMNVFEQVQKKIAQHSGVQIEARTIVKPRNTEPQVNNVPQIGYNQFRLMRIKEQQEKELRQKIEDEKKKYIMQKQAEKNAPTTKKQDETIQQYMDRMVQQMAKQNKSTKKKVKLNDDIQKQAKKLGISGTLTEEARAIEDIMKLYSGEKISFDGITAPEIKPPPILLNYDVLFKTTKIIKQALQKPPESEQNPMLPLYKGRYAMEFIFSGGDFTDGPYGTKPRKAPKLPFPKHRLTLQPWEYYGVSPDEYFATKDPHFTFKARYVPVREFYNELPRPKAEPRYYQFDVDSILAKRYSDKHTEYQFQATYVGYKQKHWTPIHHLKIKCPKAVLDYEIHERNRLFCEIMNVKVKKVKISFSACMLSHKFSKGKKETPQIIYIKGNTTQNQDGTQRISNLEVERKQQEPQYEEAELSDDEKKRRTSKETRMMEDEWDPTKDDTLRARRNQQRKDKIQKHLEEAAKKAKEIEELKEKGQYQPRSKSKSRKQTEKQQKKRNVITNEIQEEINQFDSQFQESQPFLTQDQDQSDQEQDQQRQLTEDDLQYSRKLQQIQRERTHYINDMDVDLNQSMLQFNFKP